MSPTALLLRSTFLLALLAGPAYTAESCAPRSQDVVIQFAFDVERATRVTRMVEVPAGARLLVEAFESGINTRLEVRDGEVVRRADNTMRRWAPQRMVLEPGAARRLEIAVIGQERSRGSARVRLSRITPQSDARCVNFWERIAAADADFSLGEVISGGKLEAPPGNADRAYADAALGYARAIDAARPLGGFLFAQAELIYAAAELIGNQAWDKAEAAAHAAEKDFIAIGDEHGRDRARFFRARAQIYISMRVPERAERERQLEQVHDTFVAISDSHRRRREDYDAAFALTWAAFAVSMADRFPESIAEYQRAIEAFEPLDEPVRKVQLLQNIANGQFEIGRLSEALANYSAALQAADPVEEIELYQIIVNNIAYTEFRMGKHDAALRRYSQALALAQRMQNRSQEARALHGLGTTYHAVGNFAEAFAYLERALAMRSVELDGTARADTLRALADVLRDSGKVREALARREEASAILSQGPMHLARNKLDIAHDRLDLGELPQAALLVRELLADQGLNDPVLRAHATVENARIALAEGQLEVAARDAVTATRYFNSQELIQGEFGGLLLQARIACARGDRATALETAEVAMQRAEEIRISSNNPTLRASLWRPLRPAFDFTIGVLAGSTPCGKSPAIDSDAALAVAEASRNRALMDIRRRAQSGADAAVNEHLRELFEKLGERRAQLEALSDRVPIGDPRLRILRNEITGLTREIDLAGSQAALPPPASGTLQRSLRADIAGVPSGTAVVEYWLGAEKTFAWLITRGKVQLVDLGPTAPIAAAARALHESMRDWMRVELPERLHRSRTLQALIVAPLPAELLRAHTLYFIPDGALHTVPFAALASGTDSAPRFLIDSHDVAVAPALRAITAAAAAPLAPGATALVVADPVYSGSDSRFGARNGNAPLVAALTPASASEPTLRGVHSWQRLPASSREASEIAKLIGPQSVELLSGFDASRDNVLARNFEKYQIVHFAVHAIADTEAPQLSALILSTVDANGRARVGEVFAGDLSGERMNAGLVVLSGCDTALGSASAGEGLLGMRYAAHAAGARTVIASLWPVMDASGARLMEGLYTGIIREHLSPVAALSRSMRAARRSWPDPALWGAFDASIGAGS